MNTPLREADILSHPVYGGHLLVTSDQNERGRVTIAIAAVRQLASIGGRAVYAVDRLDGKNLSPVRVDALEGSGWVHAGHAIPGHAVEVACGRGGGKIGLDNAGGGVQ